jgi:hypothetical protein
MLISAAFLAFFPYFPFIYDVVSVSFTLSGIVSHSVTLSLISLLSCRFHSWNHLRKNAVRCLTGRLTHKFGHLAQWHEHRFPTLSIVAWSTPHYQLHSQVSLESCSRTITLTHVLTLKHQFSTYGERAKVSFTFLFMKSSVSGINIQIFF